MAYWYVSAAEAAVRVIVKSKLAKTVAVEVQISTAFVVLVIPRTTAPAPVYLEELAGATASATTGFASVIAAPRAVVYVLEILTILIHVADPMALALAMAAEATEAARLA